MSENSSVVCVEAVESAIEDKLSLIKTEKASKLCKEIQQVLNLLGETS